MTTPHVPARYRPDIDGLRAVAVGSVIVFHAFARQHFGGFVGVDIFFVISGYLISGILLRELDEGRFSFLRFYARRVRRIYPALVVMMAAVLGFGWLELFDADFHRLALHVAASAGFIVNLVLYREAGYFDTASDAKPLLHLWSLGVEEQFYIVWPVLLLIAHRIGKRLGRGVVWGVLAALMLASFTHAVLLMRHDISAAFYWPTARGWELLAGAALALAHARGAALQPRPAIAAALGAAGAAAIAASLIFVTAEKPFPGWNAVPAVAGAVLLLAAGPGGWVNRWLLGLAPMRWVGAISYPLYLWHWPLLAYAAIAGFDSVTARAIAMGAAVLLAWLTMRLVEEPLRFGSRPGVKLWGLITAMAALGLFGLWAWGVWGHKPLPSYTADRTAAFAHQLNWQTPVGSADQKAACYRLMPGRVGMAHPSQNDFCYLLHDGKPDVAMIGDSLNLSLFPGMAHVTHHNLLLASASEAAPFYDSRTTDWPDRSRLGNYRLTNQALDFAIASRSIRVVLLSYLNADRLFTPSSGHYIQDMRGTEDTDVNDGEHVEVAANPAVDGPATMEAAMRRTLTRLRQAHKQVIVIFPNRRMSFNPASCLDRLRPVHAATVNDLCAVPDHDENARRRQAYVTRVEKIVRSYPNVTLFDASAPLCEGGLCYAMRNGHMLYRDDLHVSEEGAALIAPGLEQAIDTAMKR
ncbi:acyltransferase family protein [Novosphingobium terrae]|uniref:acyltransferase family protein n=1 Tax=Novosphingobium terrae TaxID=2726189 RepID=UPI00197FF738|nr:acyltransferase family protein [Novosphingobium terrae]